MSDLSPQGFREVVDELLASGEVDWVSLDDVVWCATLGDRSTTAERRTMDVLQHFFANHLMVPGDLGETGFEDWSGSPSDWVKRAITDLERLDWNPMGAGFWLRLAGAK